VPPHKELVKAITAVLALQSPLTAREIASRLLSSGVKADKSRVNKSLYAARSTFRHTADTPPFWSLATSSAPGREPNMPQRRVPGGRAWLPSLGLYPWQQRALDGWVMDGHRGVVEAVTGAGKTRLAMAAIASEVSRGSKAVAIVPTTDLQGQWHGEIVRHLIQGAGLQAKVGLLGDGNDSTLANCDILVATVQSACQRHLDPPTHGALLIADEVHHYGAAKWSKALEPSFDRRLGLTATYERDDGGVQEVLDPYFGSYRYRLGYREALADDVIAHFKVAFIGVRFEADELDAYQELDEKARKKRSLLVNQYGLTPEPFGLFMREVVGLSKSGADGAKQAGLYLSAFSKRRQVLAKARGKFDILVRLAPAVGAADRTVLFSQTVEAAEEAVEIITGTGLTGGVVHALLEHAGKQDVFDAFRDGDLNLIAAPKLLDEGIDVPDADLAIVLASSRSRRQMVQRMGRVVRKKQDGRVARLAVLFVEGTSEDPRHGAHEDFIGFVVDAADDCRVFGAATDPKEIVAYLNAWA
jgi:superfamily II DNA or RNA helicase